MSSQTRRHYHYDTIENYTYPVTMPLRKWISYVGQGNNVLYGDAIQPTDYGSNSNSTLDGAVIPGHVRQNPMTAMIPSPSFS